MRKNIFQKEYRGFTLIEMIISIAIFTIIVVLGLSAVINVLDSNRKSHSLQSAVDNINSVLEDISRNMRVGTTYHCDGLDNRSDGKNPTANPSTAKGVIDVPQDCYSPLIEGRKAGGSFIAFEKGVGGDPTIVTDQVVYRLNSPKNNTTECLTNSQISCTIEKSTNGGGSYSTIISPDVQIKDLRFFVQGSTCVPALGVCTERLQPKVFIIISGSVTIKNAVTPFNLQTTVSQRVFDI